jgi:putative ABC transport system permease protein
MQRWPVSFWQRKRQKAELDEEVRSHLEMAAAEHMERGETGEEAERAARREFGNAGLVKEVTQDMQGWRWLDDLAEDARFGLRMLAKSPGFAAAAVLTLALGIGANTAIFSVFKAVLLNALPYRQPERLVRIAANDSHTPDALNISYLGAQDLKERGHSTESISLYRGWGGTLRGGGRSQNLRGMRVSYDFFQTLGILPALGRSFQREEDRPGRWHVVLLSHGFWKERFGGRTGAVGETMVVDEEPYLIIGVLPENFLPTIFNLYSQPPQVWAPLGYDASLPAAGRSWQHLRAVARLGEGLTLEQARAQMNGIAPTLAREFPRDYPSDLTYYVTPLDEALVGKARKSLWLLMGAAGLVLLIACANATNLLLSRGAARRREMALRAALGARPARLARQLLTEATLTALLGGVAGVMIAQTSLQALLLWAPVPIPRLNEVRLDGGVLLIAIGVCLLTGIIVGLMPALAAARSDQRETLQQGTRGASGTTYGEFRRIVIAGEVALAFLLTLGTGLLLKSLHRVLEVDPGFQAQELYVARYSLAGPRYAKNENILQFEREAMNRVRAMPGVENTAIVSTLPLGGSYDQCDLQIQDRPTTNGSDAPTVDRYYVSPDYFRTMGIRLLRGRFFNETDAVLSVPTVAIISETAARKVWPNEDAIGKHIQLGGRDTSKPWATIVGIVGDVLQYGLDTSRTPSAYLLYTAEPGNAGILLTRGKLTVSVLQRSIERELGVLDRDVPVDVVIPMENLIAVSAAQRSFLATLIGCFGGLALMLSIGGIYGVLAYQVTQRTSEIGIRMALGAPAMGVLRQVIYDGMTWAALGVAAGAATSLALRRVLASQLYGVAPIDATTFAGASALLVLSAFLACLIPARRAMRVDPMVALRYE